MHGQKFQLNPEFRTWQLTVASKITCPVLALHGEKDEYGSVAFPSYIVEQSTGQAQLNIIQSCGHMPHKTHTKQVLLAIDDFINDLS
ncbi:alpha/beta hydrolase [Paraglaciecola sp. Hal342]